MLIDLRNVIPKIHLQSCELNIYEQILCYKNFKCPRKVISNSIISLVLSSLIFPMLSYFDISNFYLKMLDGLV